MNAHNGHDEIEQFYDEGDSPERGNLESLKLAVVDGDVRVAFGEYSADIPKSVWELLTGLTAAELLAARAEVEELFGASEVDGRELTHHGEEEEAGDSELPVEERAELKFGPLVIGGREVAVPGVGVVTYASDPTNVKRTTDGRPRTASETILGIVIHTTGGRRGIVKPGWRDSTRALNLAKYQATTSRQVSWHLTIDTDGTVVQSADTAWLCWHAGHVNARTVGIELVQDKDGALYDVQVSTAVQVIEVLCRELGVPRRVPVRGGQPYDRIMLPDDMFVGVYGHRNVWSIKKVGGKTQKVGTRGPGDPGDAIFAALLGAGFAGAEV